MTLLMSLMLLIALLAASAMGTVSLPPIGFHEFEKEDIDFFLDGGSTGIKIFANPAKYAHAFADNTICQKNKDGEAAAWKVQCSEVKDIDWDNTGIIATKMEELKSKFREIVQADPNRALEPLPIQVTVVIAATAGNRGRSMVTDAGIWATFNRIMASNSAGVQVTIREFKNSQIHTEGARTVWGTQEAMYEAHTAIEGFAGDQNKGFFSSGGASAQFGMEICSNSLYLKWKDLMAEPGASQLLATQCSVGTQKKPKQILSWSKKSKISALDGSDLPEDIDASCGTDLDCWALGSFFNCPGMGFVKLEDDETSEGVAGYKATLFSMLAQKARLAGFDDATQYVRDNTITVSPTEAVDYFKKDTYIAYIKEFVDEWRVSCLQGADDKVVMALASPDQKNAAPTFPDEDYQTTGLDSAGAPKIDKPYLDYWSNMYANAWFTSLGFIDDSVAPPQLGVGGTKMIGTMFTGDMDWGAQLGMYASGGDNRLAPLPDPLGNQLEKLEHDLMSLGASL